MSDAILSQQKMPKLVVVMAFDPDDDGVLQVVFGPAEQQSVGNTTHARLLRRLSRKCGHVPEPKI
jgi:hypothetical protein